VLIGTGWRRNEVLYPGHFRELDGAARSPAGGGAAAGGCVGLMVSPTGSGGGFTAPGGCGTVRAGLTGAGGGVCTGFVRPGC